MFIGIDFPEKGIEKNNHKYFIPASNTKLFTTFFALETLGKDYKFRSEFSIKGKTIYIKTLGNPLLLKKDIDFLVSQINDEIDQLILDMRYLHPQKRPYGWCIDDIGEYYAPPVSEINFEFNRIEIKNGLMYPENSFYKIMIGNKKEVKGKRVFLTKYDKNLKFSVNDPLTFFIHIIEYSLLKKNLLKGKLNVGFKKLPVLEQEFAKRSILDILKITNKESENILAEMLLLYTGMYLGKPGLKNSLNEMKKFYENRGIKEFTIYDGSGLSHYNLVTPNSIVKLLMVAQENINFKETLSIGSVDGTLKNRLNPRIIGKTGTLWAVQNLSGYLDDHPFSILINNEPDQEKAKKYIDSFLNQFF